MDTQTSTRPTLQPSQHFPTLSILPHSTCVNFCRSVVASAPVNVFECIRRHKCSCVGIPVIRRQPHLPPHLQLLPLPWPALHPLSHCISVIFTHAAFASAAFSGPISNEECANSSRWDSTPFFGGGCVPSYMCLLPFLKKNLVGVCLCTN